MLPPKKSCAAHLEQAACDGLHVRGELQARELVDQAVERLAVLGRTDQLTQLLQEQGRAENLVVIECRWVDALRVCGCASPGLVCAWGREAWWLQETPIWLQSPDALQS